jgi:nucleolar protein 58
VPHALSSNAKPAELTRECSAGYALLKSKDKKIFDKGDELSKDVSTVVDSLKLKKFQKFENAVTALNEAAALTDGKVSSMLSNLLQELKDESKASCMLARISQRKNSRS